MITIFIYGLDQFVVGRLSSEMTKNLAALYEVNESEINFVAPSDMIFHKGVEQTSWNILIHVHAPMKVSVLQNDVAKFLLESIGDVAINKAVEFYYYSQDNRYEKINEDYPRFITEENVVNIHEHDECCDDDCCDDDCDDEYNDEEPSEDDLYTGDIFEGIFDKDK